MKIVVLDGYPLNPGDLSWEALQQVGEVTIYDRTPAEETVSRATDAEAIFTNKVTIDRTVIMQLPRLKYVGILATGYNMVDLAAAREAGIVVTNIPAYSTASVVQMVFAHILNHTQQVALHADSVRRGEWTRCLDFTYHLTPQTELAGKTLGIIGFGQIGQAVAQAGLAFGMKILFNNRSRKRTTLDARQVELDELLASSDFISINCPLTDENAGFINRTTIGMIKPSALLINTGRGQLINEQELADALNGGRIAGAGLDVLSAEPPNPGNPLITARNCYITPHIAWATTEARSRLMQIAVKNLQRFIAGSPQNVVNSKQK